MRDWIEIKRDRNYLENSKLLEYELKHVVITPPPKPDSKNPGKMIKFKSTPNEHGIIQEFSSISDIPFDSNNNNTSNTNTSNNNTNNSNISNNNINNNNTNTSSINNNNNSTNSTIYIRYDYHHLPDDYEDYLINTPVDKSGNYLCKYTTIPFKDGSYMKFTLSDAVKFNLLDFVHYFGIKCTGVDLARRDQFKFVNFNHLLTFKNDLRYTPDTNFDAQNLIYLNQHSVHKPEKFKLWGPIHQLLTNFAGIELIRNKSDMKSKYEQNWLNWHIDEFQNPKQQASVFYPWAELSIEDSTKFKQILKERYNEIVYSFRDFPLEFYSKIVRYDPSKQNGMVEVVDKLLTMINDASLDVNNIINKIRDIMVKFSSKDKATFDFINEFRQGIFNSISSIYEIKIKIGNELDRVIKLKQITSKYTQGFVNEILKLIENIDKVNLKAQLEGIVPHMGDRIPYVIVNPNQDKLTITSSKGDDKYGDRKDKGYLLDQLRILYSDDEIYDLLDYRFYFNQLCKSLCNYLAIEYNPAIADYLSEEFEIEHPDMTADEIKNEMDDKINNAIKIIMKDIVNRYYPETSISDIKKKYSIAKIENKLREITPKDYADVDELSDIVLKNMPIERDIKIENIESMINNSPVIAKKKIMEVLTYLDGVNRRAMLSLQAHKVINFDVRYLNQLNQLISVYNNILNHITTHLEITSTRRSGEKLKLFIWCDEIKTYKKQDSRAIYKFEIKEMKEKNKLVKGKKMYSWIIPKYVLKTGGTTNYSTKLIDILNHYFMLYDKPDLIRCTNNNFSFWEVQHEYLFKHVILLINELSKMNT